MSMIRRHIAKLIVKNIERERLERRRIGRVDKSQDLLVNGRHRSAIGPDRALMIAPGNGRVQRASLDGFGMRSDTGRPLFNQS